MKASTRCYAIRALLDIAVHRNEGRVILKDIAQRQQVSVRHLARSMVPLVNAGIVHSYKGIGGGFTLGKSPAEIKVSDIYRICKGSFSIVDCTEDTSVCHHSAYYDANDLWGELQDTIFDVLDSRTIEDLVDSDRQKREESTLTYSLGGHSKVQERYAGVYPS